MRSSWFLSPDWGGTNGVISSGVTWATGRKTFNIYIANMLLLIQCIHYVLCTFKSYPRYYILHWMLSPFIHLTLLCACVFVSCTNSLLSSAVGWSGCPGCAGSHGRVELGSQESNRQTCRAARALHYSVMPASTARTSVHLHDGSTAWMRGTDEVWEEN